MEGSPRRLGYGMPPEWENHEATWLSWPKDPNTFPPEILGKVEEAFAKMAAALSVAEEVRILVNDERMERRVRSILKRGERVAFRRLKTVDVWVRDYGPTYLKGPGRGLVKWRFNAWGDKYEDLLPDNESGELMAQDSGGLIFRPGMVLEGGSIDVDGVGTVMTTEQCLLSRNRNPEKTRSEIEDLLREYLSVQRVLWIKSGIEGDDTDGHVDDVARFVAPGRVAVATEPNKDDSNHGTLESARGALESWTGQGGRRLEVFTLPMPRPVFIAGERLPASHLNFYIGNEVVLLPTFGGESDKKALGVLKEAFPRREVMPIDCRALVHGLGTIHCVTQQVPAL